MVHSIVNTSGGGSSSTGTASEAPPSGLRHAHLAWGGGVMVRQRKLVEGSEENGSYICLDLVPRYANNIPRYYIYQLMVKKRLY